METIKSNRFLCFVLAFPLVFYPGIFDLFSLPKTLFLSFLTIFLIIGLLYSSINRRIALPQVGYLGLMLFAFLLSYKNVVNPWQYYFQVSLDLMGMFLFWYVCNKIKREEIPKVLAFFVTVCVLLSLSAVVTYLVPGWNTVKGGRGGLMGNTSFTGAIIGMALPAALYLIGYERTKNPFLFLGASLIFMLHIILLDSRTTLIGVWIMAVIWAMLAVSRRLKRSMIESAFVIGVFVFCTFLLFQPYVSASMRLEGRFRFWQQAGQMVLDYPVFGVGRGNFSMVFPVYGIIDFQPHLFLRDLHNDFYQLLIEAGPLALLGFALFLLSLVKRVERVALQDSLSLSLFLSITAMVVHMLFNFPLEIAELAMPFWLFCGFLWVGTKKED